MAIYDFEGHESIDNKDYTGKWRYIEGLPFIGPNLQNSIVSFDKYLLVAGDNVDKEKQIYYFDVETEKWFDTAGEIPYSAYCPSACPMDLLCKNICQ